MKLKFKHLCQDKYNGRYYKKGDIVEFEEERAKEILSNDYGFADVIEEVKKEPTEVTFEEPKEEKEEVKEEEKEEEKAKEEKPKRKRTKTKA
ncbi:MAG: hypothetical protein MR967_07860 [Holdemanella sp.]|uniref:hypothetical protein n=1 Tax=Holdemanella sp. TaxID=1971762 RepID=UPI002591162F|nr:hypothetical protein [Holdemanella sp.]MCI7166835.1 hypothetical protein [Holdemanella sp.]